MTTERHYNAHGYGWCMTNAVPSHSDLLETDIRGISTCSNTTKPMPLIQPLTIASYQRKSEGDDIDSQSLWLNRMMLNHGHDYDNAQHFIDRDVSATKYADIKKRPQGRQLLDLIEKGGISKLFVYRLDRLFRDSQFAMSFLKLLAKKNVELYSSDFAGNVASADGRFLYGMQMLLAERETGIMSERVIDKAKQMRQDLIPTYKTPPYGWDIVGLGNPKYNNGKGQVDINWHEQAVIEWAKAKGNEKGMSNKKVADILNARNISTKKNCQWSASSVNRLGKNKTQEDCYEMFEDRKPKKPIQYPFRPLQKMSPNHYSKY